MKLENWSVSPERRATLQGHVYGHEFIPDGTFVQTNRAVSIDKATQSITTASGSVYTLGNVDPKWEALYPNSKERFFANPATDPNCADGA